MTDLAPPVPAPAAGADTPPAQDPLLSLQKALSGPLAWALHSALHLNHPDDKSRELTAWLTFKQNEKQLRRQQLLASLKNKGNPAAQQAEANEPSWKGFSLQGFNLLTKEQLMERAKQHASSGPEGEVERGLGALTSEEGLDSVFGLKGAPEGRTSKVGVVLCVELADGVRRALLPYGLAIPFVPGGCPPFPIDDNWLANFQDDLSKDPVEYGRMAPQIFSRLPAEVSMQWVEEKNQWQAALIEQDKKETQEAARKRRNAAKKARKQKKIGGAEGGAEAEDPKEVEASA